MAGPAYFIAALAVCFSMAAAVATASNTPGHNPCSFAELPIQYCKSFLQKGRHCSKPSFTCCALVFDIFMVNPSCLCEAMKPSFLGVAVDPARVSLLPELCHLPTNNLHCFAPPPSSSPITHPPPATPPSSSISSPPSNPPSGSVEAPSSNAPPASVEARSSSRPSGPVVEPPANAPSSSISVPPSHPPSSSIATPPTSVTAPASAPVSNSHPPATSPAAAPSSSGALKLATSLAVFLANLAFATAFFCSI